jgi:hypothetical protein
VERRLGVDRDADDPGVDRDADLGAGRPVCAARRLPAYDVIAPDSKAAWLKLHVPWMLHDGITLQDILACIEERYHPVISTLGPQRPPLRWSFRFDADEIGPIGALGERLHDDEGGCSGRSSSTARRCRRACSTSSPAATRGCSAAWPT